MLTSTGSSGLYKAPVSKGLLLVPSALSVLLVLLFHHYLSFFQYNVQEVKEDFQIWRIVLGRIICLDLKDTLCSSMLIYNFRIFERRYGSRKFTSFLLGTWILSALLECVLVEALRHAFGVAVNRLPSGFLAPIFALFVPFYCSIPGVQVTVVFGHFPVSNKTLVYIVGLQLLTSSPSMSIIASSGLVGMLNWSRLFTPLRHGLFPNVAANQHPAQEVRHPATEEQIAQLMEMGFSRADVLEALRSSNNDVNMASNILLQH